MATYRPKLNSTLIFFIFFFFMILRSQGLSLTVNEVECIGEEIRSSGDAISGSFVVVEQFRFWRWSNSGIDFHVVDPLGKTILEIKKSSRDKFEVLAPTSGIYKFCFQNHISGSQIVVFHFHVGHLALEEGVAKDELLGNLVLRIAKLKEALEATVAEQYYLKARETRHRKTNESTRRRVEAYSFTVYVVLTVMSGIQAYLIRRMFKDSHGRLRV